MFSRKRTAQSGRSLDQVGNFLQQSSVEPLRIAAAFLDQPARLFNDGSAALDRVHLDSLGLKELKIIRLAARFERVRRMEA